MSGEILRARARADAAESRYDPPSWNVWNFDSTIRERERQKQVYREEHADKRREMGE